jgi:hypothetical protein
MGVVMAVAERWGDPMATIMPVAVVMAVADRLVDRHRKM